MPVLLVWLGKAVPYAVPYSHPDKSLDPKLWVDDTHLDPKHGKKVFDDQGKAVKELGKLLKKLRA